MVGYSLKRLTMNKDLKKALFYIDLLLIQVQEYSENEHAVNWKTKESAKLTDIEEFSINIKLSYNH